MRRRKRLTITVLAGAFAVAAFATPAAQAMPPDLPGDQVRALQEAKAKSVRPARVKSVRRVSLPRQPIREYEPRETS
jgi:hypothetical protein